MASSSGKAATAAQSPTFHPQRSLRSLKNCATAPKSSEGAGAPRRQTRRWFRLTPKRTRAALAAERLPQG